MNLGASDRTVCNLSKHDPVEGIAPWAGVSIRDLAHLDEADEIATVTLCLNQHEVPRMRKLMPEKCNLD